MKSRTERWNLGAGKFHKQKFEQSQELYKLNPDKCLFCQNEMPYLAPASRIERKFCGKSCAGKYNNTQRLQSRSFYQKGLTKDCFCNICNKNIKIGKNANSKLAKCDECKIFTPKKTEKTAFCKNCGKEFKTYKNLCCSKDCSSIRKKQGSSLGGRNSASKITRRSKDEINLFQLCKNYFKSVRHNEIIKDGWDADIIIDDYNIAILWNGPWHYKQLSLRNHSLPQVQNRDKIKIDVLTSVGWKVLIFEDRFYNPTEAFEEIKKVAGAGFEPL